MPRLVRRKPLATRIKDALNPGDLLLWLSEEFETRDWDNKHFATPVALGLHFVLLIARANSGESARSRGDDVFGDDYSGTGWFGYIVRILHPGLCSLLTYRTGCFPCLRSDSAFYRQRSIHFPSKAALSIVRKLYRCSANHTLCTSSTSRFVARCFVAITFLVEHTWGY